MEIRRAEANDIDRIMEIFEYARDFMARTGNPNQWGRNNWPPRENIERDIDEGKGFVCRDEGRTIGYFFFDYGEDVEDTYKKIYDGKWSYDENYGVIHRIAGDGSRKGIGEFCINWAFEKCGYVRIDTHGDNKVVQSLLKKLGFNYCGIIYVEQDNDPRLAFDKKKQVIE